MSRTAFRFQSGPLEIIKCAISLSLLATLATAHAGSLTEIYAFPQGQSPSAGVTLGPEGNLYGVTRSGGTYNNGTIFQVTPSGQLVWSISLNSRRDGSRPTGPLALGLDGALYGTATAGGANGLGTVFKITPDGVVSNLFSFNNTLGATPNGGLIQNANGSFFGTTSSGGSSGVGSVFQMTPSGAVSNLYSFDITNGSNPYGGLTLGTDGKFYGVTQYGGTYGDGTVFQIGKSNAFSLLASFRGDNGSNPKSLIQARDRNFYGVTLSGGPNGLGTVFRYSSGTVTTVGEFTGANGSSPNASLFQAPNGEIFGTAQLGGANGVGTIFVLRSSAISTFVDFSLPDIGGYPSCALIVANDGNLYGTTTSGGSSGNGNIFRIDGFAPTILSRMASVTNRMGSNAVFTVSVSGSAPLQFQWMKDNQVLTDGGNISGSTTSRLVIQNISGADAGSYTAVVGNSNGQASTTASLVVLVDATAKITSPAANTRGTNWVITGTAFDSIHPFQVFCWYTNINDGVVTVSEPVLVGTDVLDWTNVLTSPGNISEDLHGYVIGTIKWTNVLTLPPGTNIIAAQTRNSQHNDSAIATRTVFSIQKTPFTLSTTFGGTVSGKALVSGDAPPTNGARLNIGESYSLLAKPARNFWFSSWTGTNNFSNTSPGLTFIMQPGLSLTANFVTNPFVGLAGVYAGLIQETNAARVVSSGRLTSMKIDANGKYSGKLTVNGTNYAISGSFDASGSAIQQIKRRSDTLTLALRFDFQATNRCLTGTLSASNWTAQLNAYVAAAPLPSSAATLLVAPGATNAPAGYGYATAVGRAGVLTINGRLADGSSLSDSQPIAENGQFPLYASLYRNTGVLLGWLSVTNGVPTGEITWINPSTNSGFNEVVPIFGSIWKSAAKGPAISVTNLSLQITGGGLSDLTYNVGVQANNRIIPLSGPTNSLAGSINPKTGIVTLTIGTGIAKATVTGSGAVLQTNASGTIGGGVFQRGTNFGSFTLTPPTQN